MSFTQRLQHSVRNAMLVAPLLGFVALSSCAPVATRAPQPNPKQTSIAKAIFVNPFKKGTYDHFRADPSYPKTYKTYKNTDLLSRTNASNSSVIVDLGIQRAFLMNNGQVAMDYPISSGKKKYPTKAGSFKVLEKLEKDKRSSLYGKIYDAEGKVVNSDADSRKDTVPEGGRFEGALMANWMRLTWDGIGMHRGRVPRYPASHGCIRTPGSIVPIVFRKVRVGTKVTVLP